MRYEIQERTITGKVVRWRTLVYDAGNIESALFRVLSYSPEGKFLPDYRIVCDGSVVMTAYAYERNQK